MRYLFTAALGPVGSFIVAARKTRDLYAGSRILSETTKAAAGQLVSQDLIFPAATKDELNDPEFAAVNKILAVVDAPDPAELAQRVKNAAATRLRELADSIKPPKTLVYERGRMIEHLEGMLEFYAAWTPYSGPEGYGRERGRVEDMFNARKAVKAFRPHNGVAARRKSSLDGGRETVILRRGKSLLDLVRLRENEELDGPGLLKRFLDLRVRFESTTEAAALPYVRKLERVAEGNPDVALSLGALRRMNERAGLRWDSGELLFEHESREVFETDADKSQIRRLREDIYSRAGRPDAPYYALMQADGDGMGKTLSGLSIGEHKALSLGLSDFSSTVRHRLIALDCMPVFAGGDDVLAVMPLHRLREAAWMVREEFRSVRAGTTPLTLSAGIVIAHALEPLDEVRELAKKAERTAKEEPGKDAVCIMVCPRSGAPVQATGKWDVMGDALAEITRALREERLSFGFAHDLRALLDRAKYPELDDVLPQLAVALARKKEKEQSAAKILVQKAGRREELEDLTDRILVARKIARAERDAGTTREGRE